MYLWSHYKVGNSERRQVVLQPMTYKNGEAMPLLRIRSYLLLLCTKIPTYVALSSMLKPFRFGNNTPVSSLVAVAILFGVLVGFALSTIGYGAKFQFLSQSLPAVATLGEEVIWADEPPPTHAHGSQRPSAYPDFKYLTNMVSKTNGFYARDYSLWLGWNNMRYIIETAVLHGRILNRTTIIPSFVYARACEFDLATCAAFVTMVNRGDATHSDEWRKLPIEQQMAWKIPISVMFNLTNLQQTHAVITTADYLRLHNISTDLESTDGHWDVDTYHVRDTTGDMTPSLHAIENGWYEPDHSVRVDRIPEDMRLRGGWNLEGGDASHDKGGSWATTGWDSDIYRALTESLPSGKPVINWGDVRKAVEDGERITPESSDEAVGDVLRENGFEVLYTYDGAAGTDAVKDVIAPIYEGVPRHRIRGLHEDFHRVSARVLLLRGEIHLTRKPGALYFTSAESRTRFSQTVLYDMRLLDDILALAERISDRMFALNGGRLWMAAHMRRGDFARLGWTMEADFGAHLARIKRHLQAGRQTLISMHGGKTTMYDVPDAGPDLSLVTLEPPNPDDKYYIATDERNPDNLKYLRNQGAILITDLLTQEDHREFGWPILITDVLALVEQAIMSRAAYFYAHAFSSVAGGVMNLRAGLGKDPRTAMLD
ncbi:hypothetical protein JVU11DRAFT_7873 [Chiua virens]|nr:hypothetical protein JVU11DRAFT_7873 [Chiua virens]